MNSTIPLEVKRGWEQRFPDLSGEWTHWKILGDGNLIDVVDGIDLIKALKIVEDNFGKYSSIKACRVSVDKHGGIKEEEKHFAEISFYKYDIRE